MKKLYWLLMVILLLTGCDFARETAGVLGELNQLGSDLKAKTGCNVSLNLNNGSHLTVGLLNSPLKTLPEEQKKTLTREIARYALARYPSGGKIESINVCFVTQKSYLIFHYTDSSDSHRFTAADLKKET